jgi:hypothetical protein
MFNRAFTNIFGVLAIAALVCMVVGWCVWLAGLLLIHTTSDRADAVRFLGACLGDGGLFGAALFGWLYMRNEKK